MLDSPTNRALLLALAVSLLAHGGVAAVLRAAYRAPPPADQDLVMTDIELAPDAPEAHVPGAETRPAIDPPEETETEAEAAGTVGQPEPDEPDEPVATVTADAGTAVAAALDAGPGDGGSAIATGPFDAGAGDGAAAIAASGLDAGVGTDGGTAVATGDPGDPIDGAGDPNAAPGPPGADSDLTAYFPKGELVTVLVRLDRFRGTPWAEPLENIFRPMPDYRALVGNRKVTMAERFDTLVVSSPTPSEVTATTVVVRYGQAPKKMRTFLDHKSSPVKWRASRGGALGQRTPGPAVAAHDRRVFLMPLPGLVMLVRPNLLGGLPQPASTGLDAFPAEATLPAWMRLVPTIERESGVDNGPAAVVTTRGLTDELDIPFVGKVAGPRRTTLAMTLDKRGFIIQGNLLFDDAARAAAFIIKANELKKLATETLGGKLALAPFHAYNAVKGLSFNQVGAKVAFATSISVADAQAMTNYGAELLKVYFERPAPAPAGKPVGPGPGK
ncbi:MAG TPA: hypothetical protein VML75_21155 [Kofleriaceae bacterium]|nr:hypothetical protein [Kofleriaceae bacterium]